MDVAQRIVTALPLSRLWNASGELPATRLNYVGKAGIRDLIRNGRVQFIIAEVGRNLKWITLAKCFDHFKTEICPHLAEPDQQVALEDFPESYCYFASVWSSADGPPLVVLERQH